MKKTTIITLISAIIFLSSCWSNTELNIDIQTPDTWQIPIENQNLWSSEWVSFSVTHEYPTDTMWNWEIIKIYKWDELIFTKEPEDGLGYYIDLIDNILFVWYGTSPINNVIKLFNVETGEEIWSSMFNSPYEIDKENHTLKLTVPEVSWDEKITDCQNYNEIFIQSKQTGLPIIIVNDIVYDYSNNIVIQGWQVYCALGQ
jgi:hypothetical protein